MTNTTVRLSGRDWTLLFFLTLFWGLNWPIMKIGVAAYPPITFRTLSMVGGLPVIWLAARWQGASLAIPAGQISTVARLAFPNMMIWHLFLILALKMLSSGRAAILGYTMPIWAVLFGLFFFGERLSRLAWCGIACALAGALLLLSSEFARIAGHPLGSILILIAAAGWGYGTVLMRRAHLTMPTISLTFWMLLLTTMMMLVAALLFERDAWRAPHWVEWGAIAYNAVIVFGFAHVVWFGLARRLPPVASGLSVMMIPVVGVVAGVWMLGEQLHWPDYAAMALIVVAMSTVLLKPRSPARAT
jgi:drug/metabolite transporter (DMT)-like permease